MCNFIEDSGHNLESSSDLRFPYMYNINITNSFKSLLLNGVGAKLLNEETKQLDEYEYEF